MDLAARAEEGFAALSCQFKRRLALAESTVRSWEWATKEVWNLNPIYFEMNGDRPGRRLKKEPAAGSDSFAFGTDADGRIVVERYRTEYGDNVTLYDWTKSPIEVTAFENATPINFGLALYEDDRLVQFAESAEGGCTVETYHWDGPLLVRIDIHYAERSGKRLPPLEPYQTVRAEYDEAGGLQRVSIDWLPRPPHVKKLETEVVFERSDKPVAIELRDAAAKTRKMLEVAVAKYAAKHAVERTAQKHPPVTSIDLIFSLADGQAIPWVHLCFDNKPDGYPGGSYSHHDFAKLRFPEWLPAVRAANQGSSVAVIGTNGAKRQHKGDRLARAIGEFLVSAITSARDEGVFEALPRAAQCQLGVEDPTTGAFGWPKFGDRGKTNLIAPKT